MFANDVNAGAQDGRVRSVKRSRDTGTGETADAVRNSPRQREWTPQSSWTRWTRACPSWETSSRWETSTVSDKEDEDEDEDDKHINNTDVLPVCL